jgi:hypothetical protein
LLQCFDWSQKAALVLVLECYGEIEAKKMLNQLFSFAEKLGPGSSQGCFSKSYFNELLIYFNEQKMRFEIVSREKGLGSLRMEGQLSSLTPNGHGIHILNDK